MEPNCRIAVTPVTAAGTVGTNTGWELASRIDAPRLLALCVSVFFSFFFFPLSFCFPFFGFNFNGFGQGKARQG